MSTKGYFSGKKQFEKKFSGEKRSFDRGGERSFGKKEGGYKKGGEGRSYEGRSYEKKPYEKKGFEKKPYGSRYENREPWENDGTEGMPYDKKREKLAYGKKSYENKPFEKREQKSFDKPYGKKPFEKKPYEKKGFDRGEERSRGFEKKSFDRSREQEKNENEESDALPYLIIGRNAVREAVKSGRSIDRILVSKEPDGSLREIVNLARDQKLVIREVDRHKLDEITLPFGHGGKSANHQGIVAYAAWVNYCEISDILNLAKEKNEPPFVVVLDGVMDPHNLGSIIRSAHCAGAHGVIIGKRRCASVTSAAVKTAAGAVEHMLVSKVTNLTGALERLKDAGLWIAGADMAGEPMAKQNMKGALALVIGGEGEGLSALVEKNCDYLVSIPMEGSIGSLNASVAAAILMFEKRRQDGK